MWAGWYLYMLVSRFYMKNQPGKKEFKLTIIFSLSAVIINNKSSTSICWALFLECEWLRCIIDNYTHQPKIINCYCFVVMKDGHDIAKSRSFFSLVIGRHEGKGLVPSWHLINSSSIFISLNQSCDRSGVITSCVWKQSHLVLPTVLDLLREKHSSTVEELWKLFKTDRKEKSTFTCSASSLGMVKQHKMRYFSKKSRNKNYLIHQAFNKVLTVYWKK